MGETSLVCICPQRAASALLKYQREFSEAIDVGMSKAEAEGEIERA